MDATKKQVIIEIVCIAIAFALQVILPFQINFFLPLCIALSLNFSQRLTLAEALICGILFDLVSGGPFGCCTFVLTLGVTLAFFVCKAINVEEVPSSIVSLVILICICEILRFLIVAFATPNASFFALLAQGGAIALLIEVLIGCLLFLFFRFAIKPEKNSYMFGR